MIKESLDFVEKYSNLYNIDKSHNHHHSKEVLYWATDIIKSEKKKYNHLQKKIIIQSCLLHDVIDSKYNPKDETILTEFLEKRHTKEEQDIILQIIKTMSFHKIYKNNLVQYPEWIKKSVFQDIFHIVREADLLSSYNIARMIEYRKNQNKSCQEIREEIPVFYNSRMKILIEKNMFYHYSAKKRAKQLNAIALLKLEALPYHSLKNDYLDYFRMIDYIDIDRLADDLVNQ